MIIANQQDFNIVNGVIKKLDARRKQVFVDAVILELSSDDSFEIGLAAHLPTQPSADAAGFIGGQFGTQSLGLTQDLLSGLAVGVFGQGIDVPMADGSMMNIPAFGVVLNALKTNSSVDIVSNPALLTLDNEEAKIVVGRKIPFPTTSGLNNMGQPVVSYQREDVAITLQITPRVNSSNFVTLEIKLEVQEIEEDDKGLDINQAGFITSNRQVESVALVKDNQTVVLGGLVGNTETEVETKVPILGDLPLIGALFRGKRSSSRKSNLMIFLTPHIIDTEEDMWEIQRIKEAQRQEFLRRFYGKSRVEQVEELKNLLQYSMNFVDRPSFFRGSSSVSKDLSMGSSVSSEDEANLLQQAIDDLGVDASYSDDAVLPDENYTDVPEEGVIPVEEEGPEVVVLGEMTSEVAPSVEPEEDAVESEPEVPSEEALGDEV